MSGWWHSHDSNVLLVGCYLFKGASNSINPICIPIHTVKAEGLINSTFHWKPLEIEKWPIRGPMMKKKKVELICNFTIFQCFYSQPRASEDKWGKFHSSYLNICNKHIDLKKQSITQYSEILSQNGYLYDSISGYITFFSKQTNNSSIEKGCLYCNASEIFFKIDFQNWAQEWKTTTTSRFEIKFYATRGWNSSSTSNC